MRRAKTQQDREVTDYYLWKIAAPKLARSHEICPWILKELKEPVVF